MYTYILVAQSMACPKMKVFVCSILSRTRIFCIDLRMVRYTPCVHGIVLRCKAIIRQVGLLCLWILPFLF